MADAFNSKPCYGRPKTCEVRVCGVGLGLAVFNGAIGEVPPLMAPTGFRRAAVSVSPVCSYGSAVGFGLSLSTICVPAIVPCSGCCGFSGAI